MTKKKILTALALVVCAVLLVVGSVAGTLAFLQDSKTVTNTFTVGNVAITLDEAEVDLYGVAVSPAARVTENEYKLIPGHTYVKDPTIHVTAGSEDCYIFFEVENGLGTDVTLNINGSNWTNIEDTNVYYYNGIATEGKDYVAFDKFTLSNSVDLSQYANTADSEGIITAKIEVTAYAVQASGFNDAPAAWAATFGAPVTP